LRLHKNAMLIVHHIYCPMWRNKYSNQVVGSALWVSNCKFFLVSRKLFCGLRPIEKWHMALSLKIELICVGPATLPRYSVLWMEAKGNL
jgi:hypothetical protein